MKIICVDDDHPLLKDLIKKCKDFSQADGFGSVREAADWFYSQDTDLAIMSVDEDMPRVRVRTFGNFEVFKDGKPIHFYRAKAKEILAYLIDRQGSGASRVEIFSAIYEDEEYDRPHQKQFDVLCRSLRATLEENGMLGIMDNENGSMRVVPERIDCDLYRFFAGDEKAALSYRGEYMSNYSWAMMTEAYIDQSMILRR